MAELTKEDVATIVAGAVKPLADANASLTANLTELAKNQKVLADTYAADRKAAEDAVKKSAEEAAAAAADPAKNKDDAAPKPLTTDETMKLITEAIKKDREATQQNAEQTVAREEFINSEASGLSKLPAVYKALLGPDKTKWADEAKGIVSKFEADFKDGGGTVADVGGAAREGGKTPAQEKPAGERYSFLKMPGEPGNPEKAEAK